MPTQIVQTRFGPHPVEVPELITDPERLRMLQQVTETELAKRQGLPAREIIRSTIEEPTPLLDPLGRTDAPQLRAAPPSAQPPPTPPPERGTTEQILRSLGFLLGGAGMAVPSVAGIPGDIMNLEAQVLNALGIRDPLTGQPFQRVPIGGQELRTQFRRLPELLGMEPAPVPETGIERTIERIGEEGGQAVLTVGGLGRVGQALTPGLGRRGVSTTMAQRMMTTGQVLRNPVPALVDVTQAIARLPQRKLLMLESAVAAVEATAGQMSEEVRNHPIVTMAIQLLVGHGADQTMRLIGFAKSRLGKTKRRLQKEEATREEVMTFLSRQANFRPREAEANLTRAAELIARQPDAPPMSLAQLTGSPALVVAERRTRDIVPEIEAAQIVRDQATDIALTNQIDALGGMADADLGMEQLAKQLNALRVGEESAAAQRFERTKRFLRSVQREAVQASQRTIATHRNSLRRASDNAKQEFARIDDEAAALRTQLLTGRGPDVRNPARAVERGSQIRQATKNRIDKFFRIEAPEQFAIEGNVGAPAPGLFQRIDDLKAQHIAAQESGQVSGVAFPDQEIALFRRALSQQADVEGALPIAAPASLEEALMAGSGLGAPEQTFDPTTAIVTLEQLQDLRSNLLRTMRLRGPNRFSTEMLNAVNDASVGIAQQSGRQDIIEQYERARAWYRDEIPKYTTDAVRRIMQRGQSFRDPLTGQNVALAPAAVARQFWRKQPNIGAQAQAMEQFRSVVGDNQVAVNALTEHAIADFFTSGTINPRTGRINPADWRKWLSENQEALTVLDTMQPNASQPLRDITSLHERVEQFAQHAKATERRLQQAEAGKDPLIKAAQTDIVSTNAAYERFLQEAAIARDAEMKQITLNALGATSPDIEANVRSLVAENDPRQLRLNMEMLRQRVEQSPNPEQAMNGLRRLFHDAMIDKAQLSQFVEDPSSPQLTRQLSPGKMQEFRETYKGAYAALYDRDHLKAIDDWIDLLAMIRRNRNIPTGFGTEQPDGMRITKELEVLLRTVQPTALVPLTRRVIRLGLMRLGKAGIEKLAERHDGAMAQLLNEQLFNPDIAFWLNNLRNWKTKGPEMNIRMVHAWMLKLGLEERESQVQQQSPPQETAEMRAMFP